MEGDRRLVQPHGDDDGDATVAGDRLAQDDAGPGDQEGDGGDAGKDECPESASRHVRDVDQPLGRSSSSVSKKESSSHKTTTAKINAEDRNIVKLFTPINAITVYRLGAYLYDFRFTKSKISVIDTIYSCVWCLNVLLFVHFVPTLDCAIY